jgi:hypothetical protein
MQRSPKSHRNSIFLRLITTSILSVWLVLIGLGPCSHGGFDNFAVGAALPAGDPTCAEAQYTNIPVGIRGQPAASNLIVADLLPDRALTNTPKMIPIESFSPFVTKRSLLL